MNPSKIQQPCSESRWEEKEGNITSSPVHPKRVSKQSCLCGRAPMIAKFVFSRCLSAPQNHTHTVEHRGRFLAADQKSILGDHPRRPSFFLYGILFITGGSRRREKSSFSSSDTFSSQSVQLDSRTVFCLLNRRNQMFSKCWWSLSLCWLLWTTMD